MGSRRSMTSSLSRGYSNGDSRTSSHTYVNNVRPDRRNTLCSVMAQLTEETQPMFETTLKSRAVSEASNVKFSCVVSGHPTPEITWYKDDIQLDRYCSLPKYEIFRQGTTHTLHVYNCTLDDAAIYQASARNSRGIVSCSGVLEVGSMSEYKIHQNYFAKLKQRAETWRREETNTRHDQRPSREEDEAAAKDRLGSASPPESPNPVEVKGGVVGIGGRSADDGGVSGEEKGPVYIYDAVNMASPSQRQAKEPYNEKKIKVSEEAIGRERADKPRGRMKESELRANADLKGAGSVPMRSHTPVKEEIQMNGNNDKVTMATEHSDNTGKSAGLSTKGRDLVKEDKTAAKPKRDQPVAPATVPPKRPPVIKVSMATQTETVSEITPAAAKVREGREEKSLATPSPAPATRSPPHVPTNRAKDTKLTPVNKTRVDAEERSGADIKPASVVSNDRSSVELVTQQVGKGASSSIGPDKERPTSTGAETPVTPTQPRSAQVNRSPYAQDVSMRKTSAPSTKSVSTGKSTQDVSAPVSKAVIPSQSKMNSKPTSQRRPSGEVTTGTMETHPIHNTGDTASSELESGNDLSGGSAKGHRDRLTLRNKHGPHSLGQSAKVTQACVSHTAQRGKVPTAMNTAAGEAMHANSQKNDGRLGRLPANGGRIKVRAEDTAPNVKNETHVGLDVKATKTTATADPPVDHSRYEIVVTDFTQIHNLTSVSNAEEGQERTENKPFSSDQKMGVNEAVEMENKGGVPLLTGLPRDTPEFRAVDSSLSQSTEEKAVERTTHKIDPEKQKSVAVDLLASNATSAHSEEGQNCLGSPTALLPSPEAMSSHPVVPTILIAEAASTAFQGETDVNTNTITQGKRAEHVPESAKAGLVSTQQSQSTSQRGDEFQQMDTAPVNTAVGGPEVTPGTSITSRSNTSPDVIRDSSVKQAESMTSDLHGIPSQSDVDRNGASPISRFAKGTSSPSSKTSDTSEKNKSESSEKRHPTPSRTGQSPELNFSSKDKSNLPIANQPFCEMGLEKSKTVSDSFILHLKKAALDLEKDNRGSSRESQLNSVPTQVVRSSDDTETKVPGNTVKKMSVCESDKSNSETRPKAHTASRPCLLPSPSPGTTAVLMTEDSPTQPSSTTTTTTQKIISGAQQTVASQKTGGEERDTAVNSPSQRVVKMEEEKKEVVPPKSKLDKDQETALLATRVTLNNLSPQTPSEKRSPKPSRRIVTPEPPKPGQESSKGLAPGSNQDIDKDGHTPKETDKPNPFKAPQVIRKIRAEMLSDSSGLVKLWGQFFNVLSDSTLTWYRDEVAIAELKRSAGDETQVSLAIVQTRSRDCGVYSCVITNEYGTASTDYLLSSEILSNISLREDPSEVGEEIEMTPLLYSKGVANAGCWGNKFFGRIMSQEAQVGTGREHKTMRVKVIYGLGPVFQSGSFCLLKVRNPIAYGTREESSLVERNLLMTKQDCHMQNLAREYCKIFAAETRVTENFGDTLEIIPLHLIYRPACSVPYATVEAELKGVYLRYSGLDRTGTLAIRNRSETELKCCTLQHWIYQWTSGNLLFTRLEGVDTKLTNIGISVKSTGYQGLPGEGRPKVLELFPSLHLCNYYCGLLGLRPLKAPDSLQTPTRPKGSRSPSLLRRAGPGSSSPQAQRKSTDSPMMATKSDPEPADQDKTMKEAKATPS